MLNLARPAGAAGFTLVEVMVALAVTAFGLLGLAKLQALAYAGVKVASSRSIAAAEAEGMASAMHVNTAFWQSTAAVAASPITVTTAAAVNLGATIDCSAAVCTPQGIAIYDLANFGTQLAAALPAPLDAATQPVSIRCAQAVTPFATSPNVCTLTVSWSEQYQGSNSTGALAQGQSTQSYSLVVQP
ncbi:MAG: type IV pilus modification protein PilV [Burkholderiales bacterium]|nr:type IV pilus modification protein PilV [Burkholderiales bacterium]MDE1928349.1 type IV pilus modification protein PilV [Burkholderiales bacterium]MDE2157765.1 type IV pilus modification protein PilV [Burkholderiales bacterium]MDE2502159.1 type IV pilus modification protein PilV [Burkholderiales bacterium]